MRSVLETCGTPGSVLLRDTAGLGIISGGCYRSCWDIQQEQARTYEYSKLAVTRPGAL